MKEDNPNIYSVHFQNLIPLYLVYDFLCPPKQNLSYIPESIIQRLGGLFLHIVNQIWSVAPHTVPWACYEWPWVQSQKSSSEDCSVCPNPQNKTTKQKILYSEKLFGGQRDCTVGWLWSLACHVVPQACHSLVNPKCL